MSPKLIRGKFVVTSPAELPGSGLLEDGALLVNAETVAEVGAWSDLHARYPDIDVIGSERHLVLPGFVNAHHHGRGISGLQLGMHDDYLERWILDFLRMPPLDVYLDTLYSNIRMMRSGVTTVIHHAYAREAARLDEETREALRAYRDAGLRVAYALGVDDETKIVDGDNEAFIASLDTNLAQRARELVAPVDNATIDQYFGLMRELIGQYRDTAHTRMVYGPSWHIWCSRSMLQRVVADARETGTGIHTHVLESNVERLFAKERYGTDAVTFLDSLDLFGPKTSIAHGTWLSAADIALCAGKGTRVCHNASSNLRLRNGIAPVAQMLHAGIDVCIGMDSWGINNDDDILSEMRLVANLHRLPAGDRFGPCPDCFDILRMLTINGAAAATFEPGLGQLLPQSPADLVLIDYDRMTSPHIDKDIHPVEAFVQLGTSRHIEQVLIGGKKVMQQGHPPHLDESAIADELALIAEGSTSASFAAFADTLAALKPHVEQYYESWRDPDPPAPHYTVNTKR